LDFSVLYSRSKPIFPEPRIATFVVIEAPVS
jgi:hypothetical protein